ncbi:DinB superfamily protein [Jatrophihabitans endophyticus]|uniref:DinB superfamily protein n=1 Tax=Jatrophihabitans endophyticus TaxID=1206085 RepID=A0A1M5RGW8_9ACTN|nr:DinB superfamily protein [Jatrophihabitans endophyticus]
MPVPDDKDWTWTLTRPCPECGFDARAVERADVPALLRRYAAVLHDALDRPGAGERPAPTVWSPLEYAAHVRDVCAIGTRRLTLMLTEDDPVFDDWDQDETALAARYWEQQPAAVAVGLEAAAEVVAAAFGAVRDEQWQRPGRRSNGSVFTVESFARYVLHDLAHHAWDVRP